MAGQLNISVKELFDNIGRALMKAATDPASAVAEASLWLQCFEGKTLDETEQDVLYYLRCHLLWFAGDFAAAYELFKTVNDHREVPHHWQILGIAIYLRRDPVLHGYIQSIAECNAAIEWVKTDPEFPNPNEFIAHLYGHKAFHYLQIEMYDDAEASSQVALKFSPDYLAALRIMASIALNRSDNQRAVQHLSECISRRTMGPYFWDYANRGKAFLDMDNLTAAMSDFHRALELKPGDPHVLNNMGIAWATAGNPSEAGKFYSRALQSDYRFAPPHHNRAGLFFNSKDFVAADHWFSTAIKLEPENARFWFSRAICRFERQMYGETLSDLRQAGQLGHRSWQLFYLMGMCHARLNEFTTGMSMLQTIVDDPAVPRTALARIWNNIGVMAHRNGDGGTAYQCFSKAAFIDPMNLQALANIDHFGDTSTDQELVVTKEDAVEISVQPTSRSKEHISLSDVGLLAERLAPILLPSILQLVQRPGS